MEECSKESCGCRRFAPARSAPRVCQECNHGWVAHGLKAVCTPSEGKNTMVHNDSPTVSSPKAVTEVISLILYGTHAIPIRLKILLDRLMEILNPTERAQVLKTFGWSEDEFRTAYMSQDSDGNSLTEWTICSREDEDSILPQFVQFPETRSLAIKMLQEQGNPGWTQQDASDASPLSSVSSQSSPPSWSNKSASNRSGAYDRRSLDQHHRADRHSNGERSSRKSYKSTSNPSRSRPESPSGFGSNLPQRSKSLDPSPERSCGSEAEFSENGSYDRAGSMEQDEEYPETEQPEDLSLKTSEPGSESHSRDMSSESVFSGWSAKRLNQSQPVFMDRRMEGSGKSLRLEQMTGLFGGKPTFESTQLLNNSLNASTGGGKKKVTCPACQKEYCDKGALKVHFSAVHLKEMHQCTRPGCTLIFSSRRSRNRHSANPNPKLHMDGPKKPHETAGNYRVVSPAPNVVAGSDTTPSPRKKTGLDLSLSEALSHLVRAKQEGRLNRSRQQLFNSFPSGPGSSSGRNRRRKNQPTKLSMDTLANPAGATDTDQFSAMSEAGESELDGQLSIVEDEEGNFGGNRDSSSILGLPNEDEWQERIHKTNQNAADAFGNIPLDFSFTKGDSIQRDAIQQLADLTEKVASNGGGPLAAANPLLSQLAHHQNNRHIRSTSVEIDRSSGNSPVDNGFSISSLVRAESERLGERATSLDRGSPLEMDGLDTSSSDSPQMRRKRKNSEMGDFPKAKNVTYTLCKTQAGGQVEIPIDDDNPRKCVGCGKEFQNHFSVKTHYQNVHLKLMHNCTVVGCNAAFPSKRSRDRHSSNYNLHRKLLSGTRSESTALHHSFDSQHRSSQPSGVLPSTPGLTSPNGFLGENTGSKKPTGETRPSSSDGSPPANGGGNGAMNMPGDTPAFPGFPGPLCGFPPPSLLPFATPQLMNQLAQLNMHPFHPQSFNFAANLVAMSAAQSASNGSPGRGGTAGSGSFPGLFGGVFGGGMGSPAKKNSVEKSLKSEEMASPSKSPDSAVSAEAQNRANKSEIKPTPLDLMRA